jgi:hypothetical protein
MRLHAVSHNRVLTCPLCLHVPPAGGRYDFLMEFPVSGIHLMQVTGRDEFLLIVSGLCGTVGCPLASHTHRALTSRSV